MLRNSYAVAIFATTLAAGTSLAEPPKRLSPVCAVWDGDQLIAAYTWDYNPNSYAPSLIRGMVTPNQETSGQTRYGSLTASMRKGVSKVALHAERLWFVAPGDEAFYVLPIEDFQYFEDSSWGTRLRKRKLGDQWVWDRAYAYYVYPLLFRPAKEPIGSNDEPLKGFKDRNGILQSPWQRQHEFIRLHATFDMIPLDATSATVVTLYKDAIRFEDMTIGEPVSDQKGDNAKPLPKSRKRSAKSPFEGDFWAYESGGVYYVFAHTGKVYAFQDKKTDTLEVSTVWDTKDRPVTGVVQDVVKGGIYAYGTDGDKAGARFTFRMDIKPEAVFYTTEAKDGDGFREAQDCVKAVKKFIKQ